MRPFVDTFVAGGIPKGAAQLLFYVTGLGSFLLLLMLAGELILQEFNMLANRMVIEYETLCRQWQTEVGWQQTVVNSLLPPFTFTVAQETELGEMMPVVISITQGIATALGGGLLLLALSIYWSVDQNRFERLWLSLLPAKRRAYARASWNEVETAVGTYLRNQIVQSLLAFLFLTVGAVVIGF